MLRIGKLTDYALLIMGQFAKVPNSVLSANALAHQLHLSVPTVSKILKILSESNLINSVRGASGGYHLSKKPIDISVTDVIVAMEGKLAMTQCCDNTNTCVLDSTCAMRNNWRKINKVIQLLLDKLTILDMLKPLSITKHLGVLEKQFNGK